jgi:integrase
MVWHQGKQINLGKDKDAAFKKWHELASTDGPVTPDSDVAKVIEEYLEWLQHNRAEGTYDSAKLYLNMWYNAVLRKNPRGLKIRELRPLHLSKWADAHFAKKATENSKHTAMRAIRRCFRWSKKMQLIDRDPFDGIEMPSKSAREVYLTPEQWALVMKHAKGEEFRDFLEILWETGVRPQEACAVEAKHVNRREKQWVFERKNSKGKKYNRIVLLNDRAWELTQKWMLRNPEGKLFRNEDGRPWLNGALNCRTRRLKKHIGFKLMPYAIRHTWITDLLGEGLDCTTVAELSGHRDATQVLKTYGHLCKKRPFLRKELERGLSARKSLALVGTEAEEALTA